MCEFKYHNNRNGAMTKFQLRMQRIVNVTQVDVKYKRHLIRGNLLNIPLYIENQNMLKKEIDP